MNGESLEVLNTEKKASVVLQACVELHPEIRVPSINHASEGGRWEERYQDTLVKKPSSIVLKGHPWIPERWCPSLNRYDD